MNGTIKTIHTDKGFFFIRGADGVEYFAHKSSLQGRVTIGELQEKEPCTFVPSKGPKGPRTETVTVPRLHTDNDPLAEIGL
jgi:cold shock CspA family protein